ncbi:MAG: methyl-accepting chemotaxis protein [Tardiphaga sp.]|uniref:methyl-accepting chemotaxis protein n=1 Tax=Tardiphaga sp. TaxID=1926292 RepID=UPI0019A73498|nr:HAMP domain-containing methyl-accepting chemotaxis protein [Tardiphaga sp.]MBC7584410.1 methyl-accepting chemotaxis protein [Tardiphaga sp.]
MQIGRLFSLSMLSVTGLAVLLGAEILVPQYRTMASKSEAIKAVEAYGAVLVVGQNVAGQRAPYVGPLFQDAAATPAQLEGIQKAVKSSDDAFAKARTALAALSDGASVIEVLNQAAASLSDTRAAVDRVMPVAMTARDPAIVKGFLPGVGNVVSMIEPLLNRLENKVVVADASLTSLLTLARTGQDMRVAAGSRAATFTLPLGTRRALTAAELSLMDRGQGRIEAGRERLEALVDQLGKPERLVVPLNAAIQKYFVEVAPMIDKEIPAGRTDGNYVMTSTELANVIVPAIQGFLGLRDVAIADALDRARAGRDEAMLMLALTGAAVLALLGVVAGVTFMLRRRVIAPLATITEAVSELAAGRHDVTIPAINRTDEIGTMAKSLQVFKEALISKQAADEAAAVEADAKIQRGQRIDTMTRDFEAMIGEIVETVASASTELEASAGTLTSTAERSEQMTTLVAAASEEASTNVQSVASATEEMASSVNEISRQVQDSARIASEAVVQAQSTNDRVGELAKAASRIGDVVELINTIAGQTNLLALNATIEAARAGEAGRGFAVVASEVKALAEQTAKATGEISQHITGIQAATQESVNAIREIGNTIGRMSEIASTIASAVEEQGAATQEISRNVQQAAQGTQQVSTNITDVQRGASETGLASSQVLHAAKSLSGESARLKAEVAQFLTSVRAA